MGSPAWCCKLAKPFSGPKKKPAICIEHPHHTHHHPLAHVPLLSLSPTHGHEHDDHGHHHHHHHGLVMHPAPLSGRIGTISSSKYMASKEANGAAAAIEQ